MRDADDLLASGLDVIERGYFMGGMVMMPLLSGGHDSLCACHIASQHPRFTGDVYHINTGIGAKYTRTFVEGVCERQGWRLNVFKSPSTYEQFVRERGFPGPAMHHRAYTRLKDRCVRQMCKSRMPRPLITGCRSSESVRRMGHVEPVKVGEKSPTTGQVRERKRIWTAPCHDWIVSDQQLYMDEFGLPTNKLKVVLGVSGECFCGAFAAPGELETIREHAPDVAVEIDRLTIIARDCGKPCEWGKRPADKTELAATGPLCSSCDQRAASAGFALAAALPSPQGPTP